MKKILVVDDEESIRFLYKEELEEEGYVVECAGNGEEALEKLFVFKPDLISLDIKMPGMDGLEALKRMCRPQPGTSEEAHFPSRLCGPSSDTMTTTWRHSWSGVTGG